MASEAVRIVQEVYAAFGRGDIPAIVARMSDDIAWKSAGAEGLPIRVDTRGKAAATKWFADLGALDDVKAFEPREYIDGGEHVTALGVYRAADRKTGKIYETEWAHVFTVRGGKVTRWNGFLDTEAQAKVRR